ncbi:MAG: hypothetical protein NTW65_03990 [Deltaproteobacteria bacterium]|nr:hypothetical protein [Deltaproteobacteria bacterium]
MLPAHAFLRNIAGKRGLFWILFFLPCAFLTAYVLYVPANVVFCDEWRFVPMIDALHNHQLSWQDIWAPLNEHRVVLIKFLFLFSALFLQMNTKVLMMLSVVCLLLTSLMLYRYFTTHVHNKYAAFLYLPVHYLLLSIRQWENLTMGIQLFNFAMILFLVASLLVMDKALQKNKISLFLCSICLAFLSSLFWGIGIFTFLLLIAQLEGCHLPALKIKWYTRVVLYASTLFAAYAFIYGLKQETRILYILTHVPEAAMYCIINIGNTLIGEFANKTILWVHLLFGFTLATLYIRVLWIYFRWKDDVQKNIPMVAILFIFFSLAMSLLLTYSRAYFGLIQAATSRYATLTMLGGAGLYMAVAYLWTFNKKYTLLYIMVLALIVIGVGLSTVQESKMMGSRRAYYINLVSVLQLPSEEMTDDKLQPFNVSVEHVRKGIPILQRYRLSAYAQP